MTKMYIMDVIKRLDNNEAYKQEVGYEGVADVLTKTLPMNYLSSEELSMTRFTFSYIDYNDEVTFFMDENNIAEVSFVRPEYKVTVNGSTLEIEYSMKPQPIVLPVGSPTNQEDADKLLRRYKHFENAIDTNVEMIDNYSEYQRVLSLNADYKQELQLINQLLRGSNKETIILR